MLDRRLFFILFFFSKKLATFQLFPLNIIFPSLLKINAIIVVVTSLMIEIHSERIQNKCCWCVFIKRNINIMLQLLCYWCWLCKNIKYLEIVEAFFVDFVKMYQIKNFFNWTYVCSLTWTTDLGGFALAFSTNLLY